MDKKYISRFFDFFFDFDFNHDFDTNRHALSYTSCFCTSYLFLHILFCTFLYSITHFTLYFFFLPIYIYIFGRERLSGAHTHTKRNIEPLRFKVQGSRFLYLSHKLYRV